MFLLTRKSKGLDIVTNLAIFESKKDAERYKNNCMSCHEIGKYEYDISVVPYLELKEEYK